MTTATRKKGDATAVHYRQSLKNLVDALDRMYGRTSLSPNVMQARDQAKALLARDQKLDPKDESGVPR